MSDLPPGYTLDAAPSPAPAQDVPLPSGYTLEAPAEPSTLSQIGRFAVTAPVRALGGLVDFAADPLAAVRSLVSPQLAQMERKEGGALAAPGSAAADAVFNATGIPELKPTSTLGRAGLAATEGALAGGPFGAVPAALSALGGGAGQVVGDVTGSPRLATAAALLPGLLGKPIDAVGERFRAPETQATNLLARDTSRASAAGGPDVPAMQAALAQTPAGLTPKPLSLADVGGVNMQGRGEALANTPGPGAEIAKNFLTERDAGAGPRLLTDLNENLGAGPSAYRTGQALADQQSQQAAPLYDQARSGNLAMMSPEIADVLGTPAGKAALAQAQVKMANDGVPLGGTAPDGTQGLSLQALDYVKRSLDDQIGTKVRSGENDEVRILSGLKNRLVASIDNADATATRDPAGNIVQPGLYKQARGVFGGYAESQNALENGAKLFTKQPEQIADEFSALSPNQQQLYALGARDALAQRIAKTSSGGNEALRIVGNQQTQNQLRPLFPDDQSFNNFIKQAKIESLMYSTGANALGNSRTMRRAAFAAGENEPSGGMLGSVLTAGGAALAHEPFAGIPALMRLGKSIAGHLKPPPPSPAVQQSLAQMLFSSDPAQNAATLNAISQVPGAAQIPLSLPAMLGAGQITTDRPR